MPKMNRGLQAAVLEVIDNQLRDGVPAETKQTFERLIRGGHSEQEAKRLIAVVVVHEIFNVLQRGETYKEARFVAALARLPQLPREKNAER